ncbi:MAG: Bor protein [Planctomycetota bacterium]
MAHKHVVGLGPTGLGEVSQRQYYLFFGLVNLSEVNVQNMAGNLTSYSIETERSFTDLLLMPLLLPVTVTTRTVTVKT